MFSHIFFDQNRIYIRITVFTQMSASIIGALVNIFWTQNHKNYSVTA